MTPDAFADALVLTGPTGSGKSALALDLAAAHGFEVVAMDSMTLYRGLDVGTAKPTAADRGRVPHHLLDVLDPWESASVAWWLDRAAAACADVRSRGRRPLFVGGTPLYLKALLYGLFDGPPADPALRARLEAEAGRDGREALHRRLAAVDADAAARLHPNDLRRVVRALEVWELTGRPISEWQREWSSAPASGPAATPAVGWWPAGARVVWLDWPRDELHRRIDRRADAMLAAGWLDECRRLREVTLSREASAALGYAELFDHLAGRVTLGEAAERIRARSRRYARRQLTWLRHLEGCVPVDPRTTAGGW